MAGQVLYCTNPTCGRGIVIKWDVPAQCPYCRASLQRGATPPRTPYALTHNDKQFLKSLRIAADA